ncbi:MAG: sigma-54 dependent transcriptional regulator [Deltaproteobacteria bacterium]|nr:sigma-54 dependent transcriptional regulator [Deltaproteobacteria bacterium]
MSRRVLIVDDELEMRDLLCARLARRDFEVAACDGTDAAIAALGAGTYDAVVTDLRMRGPSGIELCEWLQANRPDVPVVVITGFGNLEAAIAAIRAGAHDFLPKPLEVEELAFRLERALRHRHLLEEVKRLRDARGPDDAGELIGESAVMRRLRQLVQRVAAADGAVLVQGETGTGKELVARAIHRLGPRAAAPFVAVNCAALPEALLESELFGHAKGAFTDAREARAGLFVQARGGTLFLDEIGELSPALQPKLLRALQERRVRPVGASEEIAFDARLVAATNRDLESAVEEGRFRGDLFFRLDVLPVEVPPLRARGGDILLLAQHFARRLAERSGRPVLGISRGAAEKLADYHWPGNVRELENAIERAVALADHDHVLAEDLPERIRAHRRSDLLLAGDDPATLVPLEVIERRYVARVLEATAGNKTLAARILGVDRKTLYRKLDPEPGA